MKQTYYKTALRSLISLSIPTILEEVLSTLLQYVDTAMVGHLGEKATAAVSTTTTIGWLIHSIPSAIAVAVLAIASRANGAGDEKTLKKLAGQSIVYAFTIGALLEVLALVLSPYIPVWMGVEPDIIRPASVYFSITSITLIFRAASRIFSAMIRSIKDTKSPMFISVGENVLNIILNVVFIYGLRLGVAGAAIASCISFGIGGIAMFLLMIHKTKLRPAWKDMRFDRSIFEEILTIGLPALGTTFVSCFGYIAFARMVSGMGTTIFAAHSIAITAEQIVYIPGYGLRVATSTLVGNALGEKDIRKLRATEKVSIIITLLIMVINGIGLYLFAYPFMKLFTNSLQAASIGSEMLRLVSFSEPFFGLMIVLEGISYGMGRTKHVFACEAVSMWGIRILGTFLCVKVFGLGLKAVWLCMIADNVCKAVLLYIFRPKHVEENTDGKGELR